jgi:uncharacterized membrane protein YbhN (UPF0104 family)
MDRVMRRIVRAVAIVAVIAGVWLAARGVSVTDLVRALRSTAIAPLVTGALALLAVGFAFRAARFRTLLREMTGNAGVRFWDVVASVLLSQAANNVLPLRAGELVRTRDFAEAGLPLRRVLAAQGAEKLVEATTLILICAPVLAADFGNRRLAIAFAALVTACVPLSIWIARRGPVRPAELARAVGWSLAADAVEIALIALTLRSLGLDAGIRRCVTVLGAVNLAILLPSTPGHIGAYEAGAALGLVVLGATHDSAVAFALLYRLVQWVPITAGGGVVCALRSRGMGMPRPSPRTQASATPSVLRFRGHT